MLEIPSDLASRYTHLQDILRGMGRVAVAFSAGVDSTLVLKVARDVLGADAVYAVTGHSDSLASAEFEQARQLADTLGVQHIVLQTDEFANPDYLSNPTNRCYYCKTTLYTHMAAYCEQHDIPFMVNGTNVDDLGDFRPGLQAAAEFGVRAPAAESALTKADIRALSQQLGLPTATKPASPCLSSRVPYGEHITPEKLRRIEQAETFLRTEVGLTECRVRHHGPVARIEARPADLVRLLEDPLREQLQAHFVELGFQYVTVDVGGFRSGSLNDVVQLGVPE